MANPSGWVPGGLAVIRITPLNQSTLLSAGAAQIYGCSKYRVKEVVKSASVVNTGGGVHSIDGDDVCPAGEDCATVYQIEWEIAQATYNTTVNLYGTPYSLEAGRYVNLEILPNGAASTGWDFVAFIQECEQDGDAENLQSVNLRGVSHRNYTFRPA